MEFIVNVHDLQLEARDLAEQRAEGFKPRKDLQPWPLELPLDWAADPFHDRNWRFHLSALRMLDPIIREYEHTGDPTYLREAMPFIVDWHRYHLLQRMRHRYSWYDMSVGQRAAKLAFMIERMNRGVFSVSDEEKSKVLEIADAHFVELMKTEAIARNNHGIFQALGLKLLADVVGERPEAAEFALTQFRQIMDEQFTTEGVHTENSPDYHFYTQNMLLRSKVSRHLGDPFNGQADLVKSINPWLVFPTGEVARVGDSAAHSNPLATEVDCTMDCAGKTYAVKDLTKSGYAVIRSMPSGPQPSMLFVTGMAHTEAHKHSDELSFELFEEGRFVFVDTGKYGYKGGPMREHVISADAHNTVCLRDRRLFPDTIELSGSLLQPVEVIGDAFAIAGSLNRPSLFEQRRTFLYAPGSFLKIVDDLVAQEEREFVSSLHLAPDIVSYHRKDGFDAVVGDSLMSVDLIAKNFELEIKRGQQEPLLGWHCRGYLDMVPTTVVRAIVKGTAARVEWRVSFRSRFAG